MAHHRFSPGDAVIYRVTKQSTIPGPRAKHIAPVPHGDGYTYCVDKFWVVADTPSEGTLLVRTRQGKTRLVNSNSPDLRRPSWWERLVYRDRFPSFPETAK